MPTPIIVSPLIHYTYTYIHAYICSLVAYISLGTSKSDNLLSFRVFIFTRFLYITFLNNEDDVIDVVQNLIVIMNW